MTSFEPPSGGANSAVTVQRLNHLVLWVSDADASATFYEQALGLVRITSMAGAVFMKSPASGNYHDLGLFTTPHPPERDQRAIGMYHMAWEVATLGDLSDRAACLSAMGALVGASDHGATKSLYAHDPDGIEFEILWEVPRGLIDLGEITEMTLPLDLPAEIERYGANTLAN